MNPIRWLLCAFRINHMAWNEIAPAPGRSKEWACGHFFIEDDDPPICICKPPCGRVGAMHRAD